MKKFWTLMLALSMVFSCSIGLAACGETPKPDQNQSQIEKPQSPDDKEQNQPSENPSEGPSEEGKQEQVPSQPETNPSAPTTPEDKRPPEEQEPPKEDEEPANPKEQEKPEDHEEDEKQPDEEQKDDQEEEEAHAHSFSEWISDGKGNHSRTCVCGEKQTEKCVMKKKTVSPTCIADGYTLNYCEKCDYSFQTDSVKSNGEHVWTFTFTNNGLNSTHTRTCSACGEKQSSEKCILVDEVLVSPTCTEDGYYNYTCSVCENQIQSPSSRLGRTAQKKKGHKLTAWTPDENATTHSQRCQNEGCEYKDTQNCNIKMTETPATCDKFGSKTSTCDVCNRNTSEQIAKLDHTFGEWTQEANIQMHKHTCIVCHKVQMEDCTFGDPVVKEATCTTMGRTTTTCTKCNRQIIKTTDAIGHKFEGTYTGKPSGHSAYCSNCKQEITKSHTYQSDNFCTVCRYDGLSYNYNGGVYVDMYPSGSNKANPIHQGATTIYIAKFPYGESKQLTTTGIKARAFANNKNLRDIYIPDCLYTIDATAFEGCTNLTIHYEGSKEDWDKYFEADSSKNPVNGTNNITLKPNEYEYPSKEGETTTVSALPEAILPERRFYL